LALNHKNAPALATAALIGFIEVIKLLIALWKHAENFSAA